MPDRGGNINAIASNVIASNAIATNAIVEERVL